jgi:hypothetical protein
MRRAGPWSEDYGPEWTSMPITRLRYSAGRREWTLYSRDRNERWHAYELIGPSTSVLPLLDEIDSDPTGIFWG